MADFTMPSLGADMTEGTLLEWLVHPGDQVHRGDLVAIVDTDKAAIDVEVFTDGVIDQLLVEPGTRVPVGTPLASLTPIPAQAPAPPSSAAPSAAPPTAPAASQTPTPPPAPRATPLVRRLAGTLGVDLTGLIGSGRGGAITRSDVESVAARRPQPAVATPHTPVPPRHRSRTRAKPSEPTPVTPPTPARITPYARRRAAELGVDLTTVTGSGAGGAVVADDVVRAAERGATQPKPTPIVPVAPVARVAPSPPTAAATPDRSVAMRRAIAALMARSKREIPHYYLSTTVDMSASTAWLATANTDRPIGERLVPAALMLRATALAARRYPQLNGFWVDDAFQAAPCVHLGIAISLRAGGMIAPAIRNVDTLDPAALMAALRDLVTRSRTGRLRSSEMTGATITVTNLGDRGVEAVFGVIYPPQVALVGFGAVVERPWACQGLLGVRPVVTMTLSGDHRATDGHVGGLFLTEIERLLTHPEEL